ncbi:hypothetical protein ACIQRW_37305 [Streptomyces sp. NPDC091287]|uniref:hypothetical protein n=1 Tax=Streptomyces sp. NPDC091287 TaxID=3365988 RepID=UPI0037FE4292
MPLTDFARRVTDADADATTDTGAEAATDTGAEAATGGGAGGASDPVAGTGAVATRTVGREADGLAVASFVLGLVGLLVFNVLLGPTAIVMALLALARRTRRPGRARLGLALGIADLAVLAVLVTANGTVSWSLGG